MVFVVPTNEMGVRKGKEVEPGGRVREEIVEEWWRSWQVSALGTSLKTLLTLKQEKGIGMLLKQLTIVFSLTPPVYARPPETVQSSGSAGPARIEEQAGRPVSQTGPPLPPARPAFAPPTLHAEVSLIQEI